MSVKKNEKVEAKNEEEQKDAKSLVVQSPGVNTLALAGESEVGHFFEEFAGHGMEKVTSSDILIPRLTILQGLSPQIKPRDSAYIEGAKIGDICDVGTGEVFEELHILPVVWDKVWLEWAPRNKAEGLVNIHTDVSILEHTKVNEKRQPILPNGNYIQETAQIYFLNLTASRRPSFLPFASTQLKKSRRLMTLASGERLVNSKGQEYTPPLFYRSYILRTAEESNNQGSWYGWTIDRGPALPEIPNGKNILADALKFRDSIASGNVKGDLSNMTDDPSVAGQRGATEGGAEERM